MSAVCVCPLMSPSTPLITVYIITKLCNITLLVALTQKPPYLFDVVCPACRKICCALLFYWIKKSSLLAGQKFNMGVQCK